MQLSDMLENDAIQPAIDEVRQAIREQPASADRRAHLAQLLCLNADWRGALAQVKAWQQLAAEAAPTIRLLLQMIGGETQRAAVFSQTATPALFPQEHRWVADMARALNAPTARETLLAAVPVNGGELVLRAAPEAAERFDWLSDGDERFGPVCELILDGVYHWASLHLIQQIRFQPPASVIDLVWRQCSVRFHDGNERLCQMPVRYPSQADDSDALKLARQTSWSLQPPGYVGHGQRIWLDGDREWALLDIESIAFREPV